MKKVLMFVTVFAIAASTAYADQTCKPVNGSFLAHVVPPPPFGDCMAAFCTEGRVWGGVQGAYRFNMTTLQNSGAVPSIFFFTGQSEITLKSGDIVLGTDTGSLDLGPNAGFASLITFTGGTGDHQNATGQIRLRGELSQTEGTTAGDYLGTICTP
jgi:opacity protein-like surface antigen